MSERIDEGMNRVSRKLVVPRLAGVLIWAAILIAPQVWAYLNWGSWWLLSLAATVVVYVCLAVTVPLRVRALGWKETEDELVLRQGRIWQTLTVIPYGRIQFVDVTSGPFERALDLKALTVNTASTSSVSNLPGIEKDEADALRDRLAAKARERMSGL